ncbi:hypothetical protein PS15m_012054 [Mucor circinelloides]
MNQNQQVLLFQQDSGLRQNAVCHICGRDNFRGGRGLRIHQSKNAVCREMQLELEARMAIAEAAQTGEGHAVAGQAQEDGEHVPQPTTLVGKSLSAVRELVGAIAKLMSWICKIIYSLLLMFLGLSNVYFLYLYFTEKIPIVSKTTYLLSPNFEEEFRLM